MAGGHSSGHELLRRAPLAQLVQLVAASEHVEQG